MNDKRLWKYLSLLFVAFSWLYLFRNDFVLLLSRWDTEDYSYCYLVPLIAIYIAWKDRSAIETDQDRVFWPGLVGILLSGVFLLVGRLGSLETFIFFSMWLSLVSASIVFLGWNNIKFLVFPALILLFIIPPPSFIESTLSFNLRLISSEVSARLLYLLSIPVYLEGNIIDLGTIKLQVVDACSGLRYFLPTILLSLIVGHSLNRRVTSRIILVALSVPITIALNAIRITITGVLVRYVSPDLADGFFHDFQGWVIYLAAIALLAGCSCVLRGFEGDDAPADSGTAKTGDHDEKVALQTHKQTIFLSLITGITFAVFSFGMTSYANIQKIPAWKSLDTFPLQIGNWKGTRSYLDQETLDVLWADDYFLASYQNAVTGSSLTLLVPYYKTQATQHTAHAPTSCLLGAGWEITGRKTLGPSAATGRSFSVQQLILTKSGGQLLANFWFQQRGRIIANELANKLYLLYDALTIHRTDGALVRIEMLIPRGMTVEQAQGELDAFSEQVVHTLSAHLPSMNKLNNISALR